MIWLALLLASDEFKIAASLRFEKDHILQLWVWAERYTSLLHRSLVRHRYRWHFDDIKLEDWRETEQKADRLIEIISERLSLPDNHVKHADSKAYAGRCFRQRRLKQRRSFGSLVRHLFEPIDGDELNFAHLRKRLIFIFIWRIYYVVSKIFNNIPFKTLHRLG